MEEIFVAGGCLWGVQEFFRYVPGVVGTTAGRANGTSDTTRDSYDGYVECVRVRYDPQLCSATDLVAELFKVIDPYSINRQGADIGEKYRTGVYSRVREHLALARSYIHSREDSEQVAVEVLPLTHFVVSDPQHQDRLFRIPDDYCHIPPALLYSHRT